MCCALAASALIGAGTRPAATREDPAMPLFMDTHDLKSPVALEDVAKAHAADLATQDEYGVHYLRYWVDEADGKIFCLVDAPDAETAATVHREAHGLVADSIVPVAEGEWARASTRGGPVRTPVGVPPTPRVPRGPPRGPRCPSIHCTSSCTAGGPT